MSLGIATSAFADLPAGQDLVLSEVLYDLPGDDSGLEWVELYNFGDTAITLTGNFSLGWGGTDYLFGTLDLVGTIPAGGTFVVGGPTSDAGNGTPSLDQAVEFFPNIQNGGTTADGVALFDVPASSIQVNTIPVDVVLYGSTNDNNLIDQNGDPAPVDVGDAPGGSSISRNAAGWIIGAPSPNESQLVPLIFSDRFEFGEPRIGQF